MSRAAIAIVVGCIFCAQTIAIPPSTQPQIDQRCAELLSSWHDRFEQEHFTAVVAPPFVIAGDGGLPRIQHYRDATVLASTRALRAMFFEKQPDQPVLILLFESAEPYQRLAKKWFGDDDVPHFGFFRQRDNVMLMNVGTGTGTLVHELVHALMRADFPDAPGWFNEGLASLYEQSTIDGDSIRGMVNWRLPALQRAIQQNTLRPMAEMIDDPHFYREDLVGLNYAQARYLMMYLQEQGKLTDFYRRTRDNHASDPTGRATLEKIIAPQSLEQFERDWRSWVLSLK